jgi:hypothetical protein
MIVTSGRSALTFNAAMSASSAPTTIRSDFPLTLSPTVNCHDIFALSLNIERVRLRTTLTSIDQVSRASLVFFAPRCRGDLGRTGAHGLCTACFGRQTRIRLDDIILQLGKKL